MTSSNSTAEGSNTFLDQIIRWSLRRRLAVLLGSLLILVIGVWRALEMPVDVFPDLSAPTVTIVSDAHGLAPQEVETLVTVPIESAVNGSPGVRRVRSSSGTGVSVVWVEFEWGEDIYRARQIVTEKLQSVKSELPSDMEPPALAPVSSIMGEILFVGLTSDRHDSMKLRDTAQWEVQRRLKSITGVSRVIALGGDLKQFQVLVDPRKLQQYDIPVAELVGALRDSSENVTGGFLVQGSQETVIRGLGRVSSIEEIQGVTVRVDEGVPVTVGKLARVEVGAAFKRGEGSINAEPGVVIGILKQPGENTIELSKRVDKELDAIAASLPEGMTIQRDLLRQADFIEAAVDNVSVALRDGAILVALILLLFLWNWRTTLISLTAMPMSLALAVIGMELLGLNINTMTLGGLTIAIGAIVDDAIIDVENVYRRLREARNDVGGDRIDAELVVYRASKEIRSAIVFATLIVGMVYLPLFFLGGVEGRLLVPLGVAYLVALFASLLVALTLTPALCSYLLAGLRQLPEEEGKLVLFLKRIYLPPLRFILRRPAPILAGSVLLLAGSLALLPMLGRSFLPEFNEGSLTISAVTLPGTSLERSSQLGKQVEEVLLEFPEVVSTARRTGRAEKDEHAQAVFAAEIDVRLKMKDRSKEALLTAMRNKLAMVSGVSVTIGQPISHRIDHMLSGTRAAIAIKVFGEELRTIQDVANQVKSVVEQVPGAVDVSLEQPMDVPQTMVRFRQADLARYGATPGQMADALEHALTGTVAARIIEGQRSYDLLVRYEDQYRSSMDALGETPLDTPAGVRVPLRLIADVGPDAGPNAISRENAQRKVVVMANVGDADLGSVVDGIREAIESQINMPDGVYVAYGGQFESEQAARKRITYLGIAVIAGIFILLTMALASWKLSLLTMANLPLALIGGIVSVVVGGGVLSVGSLIGFITLFGIATRNGLIMITHFEHLQRDEGASFDEAIERGSLERLSPVLMTALSAALALVPLVLAGKEPGNEIQAPMGIVILGGLLTSTALNLVVIPALYKLVRKPDAATPSE